MTASASSPAVQVHALLALRWQMVRRPRTRVAGLLGAAVLLALLGLCLSLGGLLDEAVLETVAALAPQVFSGFALLAVAAPLTSAGGSDVVPPEQLVAFPVRSSTHFLGGLLLAPLNLVWVVQLLVLATVTGCLTVGGRLLPGLATTVVYVAAVTAGGQALAWGVAGLRTSRAGRTVLAVAVAHEQDAEQQQHRAGADEQGPPAARRAQPGDAPGDRLPERGGGGDVRGGGEQPGQQPATDGEAAGHGGQHEQLHDPDEVERREQQAAEELRGRPYGERDELLGRDDVAAARGGQRRGDGQQGEAAVDLRGERRGGLQHRLVEVSRQRQAQPEHGEQDRGREQAGRAGPGAPDHLPAQGQQGLHLDGCGRGARSGAAQRRAAHDSSAR